MSTILTENAEDFMFRDMPNRKILEILVPKNETVRNSRIMFVRVFYEENGSLDWCSVSIDGFRSHDKFERKDDIIPKPKKVAMGIFDIYDLHRKGALFSTFPPENARIFVQLTCFDFQENEVFSVERSPVYNRPDKYRTYTLDGKTFLPCTKEVKK